MVPVASADAFPSRRSCEGRFTMRPPIWRLRSLDIEIVPVDDVGAEVSEISVLRAGRGIIENKPQTLDRGDSLAGRPGNLAVQFVLRHRTFLVRLGSYDTSPDSAGAWAHAIGARRFGYD